jgi:hypothetical protein
LLHFQNDFAEVEIRRNRPPYRCDSSEEGPEFCLLAEALEGYGGLLSVMFGVMHSVSVFLASGKAGWLKTDFGRWKDEDDEANDEPGLGGDGGGADFQSVSSQIFFLFHYVRLKMRVYTRIPA